MAPFPFLFSKTARNTYPVSMVRIGLPICSQFWDSREFCAVF